MVRESKLLSRPLLGKTQGKFGISESIGKHWVLGGSVKSDNLTRPSETPMNVPISCTWEAKARVHSPATGSPGHLC